MTTLARVPNQPKTPVKCFRVPADRYAAAMRAASKRGEVLSEQVNLFLEMYGRLERGEDWRPDP